MLQHLVLGASAEGCRAKDSGTFERQMQNRSQTRTVANPLLRMVCRKVITERKAEKAF